MRSVSFTSTWFRFTTVFIQEGIKGKYNTFKLKALSILKYLNCVLLHNKFLRIIITV